MGTMRSDDEDMAVVDSVLAGDGEAFGTLVERYGDMVFTLVRRMLGNREEAEDLTQDIFVKVYSSLGRYNGRSAFPTWLYRVDYNAAISHMRRRGIRYRPADGDRLPAIPDDGAEDVFERAAAEKRYGDLERALSQLSPGERALITLFYMEEHSMGDIAAIMGISAANVKVKLHRIRRKLSVLMGR